MQTLIRGCTNHDFIRRRVVQVARGLILHVVETIVRQANRNARVRAIAARVETMIPTDTKNTHRVFEYTNFIDLWTYTFVNRDCGDPTSRRLCIFLSTR